jgi:hypothetical protein
VGSWFNGLVWSWWIRPPESGFYKHYNSLGQFAKPATSSVLYKQCYAWSTTKNAIVIQCVTKLHWSTSITCITLPARQHDEKPKPSGKAIILELDEMWHYLKNKRWKLWIWKALACDTGQLLDWECGRRDKATLRKLVDRLAQWDVKLYCTD